MQTPAYGPEFLQLYHSGGGGAGGGRGAGGGGQE